MCFENIINWRRLTYISVSVCIKINKIISLQIDLIVLHWQGWSLDRDKFRPILHRPDRTSFSTLPTSKRRLILLFRARWKQLYQFSGSQRESVTQSHSHTVKMKSEPWAPTGLMTCYIVSIPNLTLTESLMYILCKAGSSKIFNDKICILWNSEKLRNSNIKVTVVSHLLTNYVGQYQWVYWAMHSCQ